MSEDAKEHADWARADAYHTSILVKHDDVFQHTLDTSKAAGLRAISVTPAQGKLLNLLARSIGAKHILEVGTLGGYV